ncbi:unnamed protein product [Urochloa humidicola]
MDGKRTSTLIVIMCLVILSLTGNSAANCDCCVSLQAQICCKACAFAAGDDTICKHTCCFPCTMAESGEHTGCGSGPYYSERNQRKLSASRSVESHRFGYLRQEWMEKQ